ncbi:uracil-DNA glycosylase [Nonlabens arenilitoris]|uniref:Uracil-DNA glycosylase n=1 Tax=Nonlabens arenilitoris TaxID=1217969 RepID=A0A2S7UCD5_9FLAO|nr:uracil-DNA glycosylase [Nonlabens arenilitoris]PQJ32595.1 uracil-DNA glycosylase [Nonlabens arenilitoris]
MELSIHQSWKKALQSEFDSNYFKELAAFVKTEYATQTVYPPASKIFAAFDAAPIDQVKVVIIGQDPYHGPGQANGLCFSVADGIPHPPSLINIFKEIHTDLNIPIPVSGILERWAEQGVLLLNAVLTVRKGEAGSHAKKGWERFTDAVIKTISQEREDVIFLLWGGFAKGKAKLIDKKKHHILTSGHPSPLSANRGYWFGNKHFSQVNELLQGMGKEVIEW